MTYNTNHRPIVLRVLSAYAGNKGKWAEEKKAPGEHAKGNRPVAPGASSHDE